MVLTFGNWEGYPLWGRVSVDGSWLRRANAAWWWAHRYVRGPPVRACAGDGAGGKGLPVDGAVINRQDITNV